MNKTLPYLIHSRCSKVDPHLFCIFLQFPVLIVAELQMALVLTVGFPPGVLGRVWADQGFLVELKL